MVQRERLCRQTLPAAAMVVMPVLINQVMERGQEARMEEENHLEEELAFLGDSIHMDAEIIGNLLSHEL